MDNQKITAIAGVIDTARDLALAELVPLSPEAIRLAAFFDTVKANVVDILQG